ncbi:MAG: alanine racemase [Acidobacteriota bacterium]|nr:alanine racemase [Blastocatellia bacterium]MDW8240630.1 alanine racemase [Acidobacteriota bacterium]
MTQPDNSTAMTQQHAPHGHRRTQPVGRPTWAEIHLDHLTHNFRVIKERVGAHTKILAAVKADAYGHDAVLVARHLETLGCDWFGVALPEEGVALRQAGVTRPILCLGGFYQGQAPLLLDFKLTPDIYSEWAIEQLDAAARARDMVASYHLKVDTGMGRLGVPMDQLASFLDHLRRYSHVRMDGVLTHLASANEPRQDAFTRQQMERFEHALAMIRAAGHQPREIHAANSAAVFRHPQTWGTMVRPGGALYGLYSPALVLKPVMSLHSQIILLKRVPAGSPLGYGGTFVTERPSQIATLPIGYQDGYMRAFSNTARVIIRGRYAPVVGRVSMDLTLIDVTDVPDVALGDEVVLMGQRDGLSVTAAELARKARTISYEITCGISRRVTRVVV